jgi:hypothetical protein
MLLQLLLEGYLHTRVCLVLNNVELEELPTRSVSRRQARGITISLFVHAGAMPLLRLIAVGLGSSLMVVLGRRGP